MKFSIEFDMIEHDCDECPMCNGTDECNLLIGNDYEDMHEKLRDCPLKIVREEGEE